MTTKKSEPATKELRRVAPAKFAHCVRRTSPENFENVVSWYETVLVARVVHGDSMLSFMTYDDEHHRIAVIAVPGLVAAPPNAVGTDHIAFTYADLADLLDTYERLRDEGIDPVWCINHGPTLSLYYADPDGSRVELQIDVFATMEEASRWMRESDFSENPVGIRFDPEKMLADYKAGVPRETLLARRTLRDGESPFDHLG